MNLSRSDYSFNQVVNFSVDQASYQPIQFKVFLQVAILEFVLSVYVCLYSITFYLCTFSIVLSIYFRTVVYTFICLWWRWLVLLSLIQLVQRSPVVLCRLHIPSTWSVSLVVIRTVSVCMRHTNMLYVLLPPPAPSIHTCWCLLENVWLFAPCNATC